VRFVVVASAAAGAAFLPRSAAAAAPRSISRRVEREFIAASRVASMDAGR
jgi:hypothetical protein